MKETRSHKESVHVMGKKGDSIENTQSRKQKSAPTGDKHDIRLYLRTHVM